MAVNHGRCVISDDINVILPAEPGQWKVVTVPFNGSAEAPPIRLPDTQEVELAGIFELNQSHQNCLGKVTPASAAAKLFTRLPFINTDERRSGLVMNNLAQLLTDVPFNILEFDRSSLFLDQLRKAS
jgi:hypothetical protein